MEHVLVYSQSSGIMYIDDHERNRIALARGYSGAGTSINDPDSEGFGGRGPIPRGVWKVGIAFTSERTGAYAIPLTPVGHDAYHRTGFQIHGDNKHGDRSASSGCIVLPRHIRLAIINLRITVLEVIL